MGASQGSEPPPTPDLSVNQWRDMEWTERDRLKAELLKIQLNHPELTCVRILLHGPVGAGKSCFINSVQSILSGEMKIRAAEQANAKKSCTKVYKAYRITNRDSETLPFIFNDVMGLEQTPEDGIHPDDIVNALLGHIQDGYKFNPLSPISEEDSGFIREPSLSDKVQCVVSVVPACSISRMDNGVIDKMEAVRNKAIHLDIPHLVVMTKVDDDVCPLVKEDLKQIYQSRKIKNKMQDCSNKLGSPMKCIFPVSNYFEEIKTNDTKDVLILTALLEILKSAIDYVHENHTYE